MSGAFQETHQRKVIREQLARSYPAAEPKPELLLLRSHSPPTHIHRVGALRFPMLSGKNRMDTMWESLWGTANPAHIQVLRVMPLASVCRRGCTGDSSHRVLHGKFAEN